jgi:hypothetical protein
MDNNPRQTDLENIMLCFRKVFNGDKLPNRISDTTSQFFFISFSDWQKGIFYDFLEAASLPNRGKLKWAMMMTDPEVHSASYRTITNKSTNSRPEYIKAINKTPSSNHYDIFVDIVNTLLVVSADKRWGIYFDREYEIGVIATTEFSKRKILESYPFLVAHNIHEASSQFGLFDILGHQAINELGRSYS